MRCRLLGRADLAALCVPDWQLPFAAQLRRALQELHGLDVAVRARQKKQLAPRFKGFGADFAWMPCVELENSG